MSGYVTSKDGTTIGYDRRGDGPPVILVTGGLDDGAETEPLAKLLADRYTTFNYRRRGRGDSGDTMPYALEREIEDIEALVAKAGGSAYLYGVSSGGALALEAAAAGMPTGGIAVYEVPYLIDDAYWRRWRDYVVDLGVALAHGRRDEALALFMRVAGSSEEDIAGARAHPVWPGLLDLAPTLAYDAACLGDGRPPVDRLATITQPTLVATGGGMDMFEQAADAIAAGLPAGDRRVLPNQGHVVDPATMAKTLEGFFG